MNRTELKGRFANGCIPDGDDFGALIDRTYSDAEVVAVASPIVNTALGQANAYTDQMEGLEKVVELSLDEEFEIPHELKRHPIVQLFSIENDEYTPVDFTYRLIGIESVILQITAPLQDGEYLVVLR